MVFPCRLIRNHQKGIGNTIMAFTFTLMGLPQCGKTTVGMNYMNLIGQEDGFVFLDGDIVRTELQNLDFSQTARINHIKYIAYMCRLVNELGVNVIAAFSLPNDKIRQTFKKHCLTSKFIWCKAELDKMVERAKADPSKYQRNSKDTPEAVIKRTLSNGMWETPLQPDLILDTTDCEIDKFGVGNNRSEEINMLLGFYIWSCLHPKNHVFIQ